MTFLRKTSSTRRSKLLTVPSITYSGTASASVSKESTSGTALTGGSSTASQAHLAPSSIAGSHSGATESGSTTEGVFVISLAVFKEVADSFNNVPYLQAVTGVLLKIIAIRNEVKTWKAKWEEVMGNLDGVAHIISWIYKLGRHYENVILPIEILESLHEMEKQLADIYDLMQQCKFQPSASLIQKVKAIAQRSELSNKIDSCDNRIELAVRSYQTMMISYTGVMQGVVLQRIDTLIHNSVRQVITTGKGSNIIRRSDLVPPSIFCGRSQEINHVIQSILNVQSARVVILGFGGVGKTTLARAVLTNNQIINKFQKERYLVTCSAVTTIGALLVEIAQALRIGISSNETSLQDDILSYLENTHCILCLDSFEAVWNE
ncbi:hypothetical protein FA95DRAFT_1593736, partial [Auriscalpium vulgare]